MDEKDPNGFALYSCLSLLKTKSAYLSANALLMDCNDSKGFCVARKINNTLFKGFQTLAMFRKMPFVRNEREIRRKAI